MKSAEEMFKELGYECKSSLLGNFEYYNNDIEISTDPWDKEILICKRWSNEFCFIDMPTLKAIIKQCEELGWLDDNQLSRRLDWSSYEKRIQLKKTVKNE